MGEITGLLIALGIGIPLLVGAVLLDRRRQRRIEGDAVAPEAGPAEVSDVVPDYITQSEIDTMPPPAGPATSNEPPRGASLGFGHAAAEFATHGEVCELHDARVLMVSGEVETMRELLTPLATWSPLVIAAEDFHDDVLKTLRANRKALRLSVVALKVRPAQAKELAEVVGGELLEPSDLHAGYVPDGALGSAERWWSTMRQTRITAATQET